MKRWIIFAGMPRSGTTHIYHLFTGNFLVPACAPEEMRVLASDDMLHQLAATFRNLYRDALHQGNGDKLYSAWGEEQDFVQVFLSHILQSLGLFSYRGCIEAPSLHRSYAMEMSKALASTFKEYIDSDISIGKQPTAELSWRTHNKVFSGEKTSYVIGLRDPFKVYTSMLSLGWTSGLSNFFEVADASYEATRWLLKEKRAWVCNTEDCFEASWRSLVSIAKHLNISKRPGPFLQPEKHWKNELNCRKIDVDENDFNFYFNKSKASDEYYALVEEARAVDRSRYKPVQESPINSHLGS